MSLDLSELSGMLLYCVWSLSNVLSTGPTSVKLIAAEFGLEKVKKKKVL